MTNIKTHIEGYRVTARWGSFGAALCTYVPWDAGQSVWAFADDPEDMDTTVIFSDRLTAHRVADAIKAAAPKFISDICVEPFSGDAYPGQVDDSETEVATETRQVIDRAAALFGEGAE